MHERLHTHPIFAALDAGTLDLEAYIRLLGRWLGFHAPMEAALTVALVANLWDIAPESWQRAHLLRADLAFLDAPLPPICLLPPAPMSQHFALGCLYVVEGSTLGGRLLARRLDGLLPPGADGRQFLLAGTRPGHVSWATVSAALDAAGATADRRAELLDGAAACFAQFEAWFSESPKVSRTGDTLV